MKMHLSAMVLLAALVSGCASAPSNPRPSGGAQPSTDTGEAPLDWVVPPEAAQRPNPEQPTAKNLDAGARLFARHCTACHGTFGHGDGPVAALWPRLPKDLTNPTRQQRLTDGEIFWKISRGHQEGSEVIMPGLAEKLNEADRWRIVLFVRKLAEDAR
jgi:mono/diheme cytochrome c family protein